MGSNLCIDTFRFGASRLMERRTIMSNEIEIIGICLRDNMVGSMFKVHV